MSSPAKGSTTPNKPQSTKRSSNTPGTPSSSEKKWKSGTKNDTNVICSIRNMSRVLLSPSKAGQGNPTTWFEFGTIKAGEGVKRSVSFDKNHHSFLSSQEIVDNPYKAVELLNVQENDDGGYKMNSLSSFGKIVNLKKPYPMDTPAISSISDILFTDLMDTFVSVEGRVVSSTSKSTTKCTIYIYELFDGYNSICINSFSPLNDVNEQSSYKFHNVYVDAFNQTRIVQYKVISSHTVTDKVFKEATDIISDEEKVIRITNMQTKPSKKECAGCHIELADEEVDDEGFYECKCKTAAFLDTTPVYSLVIQYMDTDDREMVDMQHAEFLSSGATSKKDLLRSMWKVRVNDLQITSITKSS